jgi:SHS2 domain-containing protein
MRPYARSEEHVGEWKLSLWADTLEEIFLEAARVIARECGPVRRQTADGRRQSDGEWERVTVSARDPATLLVDWLNEMLGRSEIHGRAYDEFRDLKRTEESLSVETRGRPVASWQSAMKAATYHGLELKRQGNRWKAVVLFDV